MNVQYMEIAERLKEERLRMGVTQDQMAEIGGVAKRTYCNYEAGERVPDAAYLSGIGKEGADLVYILTGKRVSDTELGLSVLKHSSGFILRLRQLVGETPAQIHAFAARCLISSDELLLYLDGEAFPKVDTLIALATLTGASLDWLLLGALHEAQLDPRETAFIQRFRLAPEPIRQALATLLEWHTEAPPASPPPADSKG